MTLLLKNTTFIHWETLEFKKCHLLVEEGNAGTIQCVENIEELASQGIEIIDCTGKFVTKSFGLGHHHAYSALAKGMPAPKKNPNNFHEILQYIWWTLDKCLDKEMVEYSALVTAMACAKAGSTFVIDHHASPNFIEGSLEIMAQAFEKVGISHLLCYEITDRDGMEKAAQGLKETANYLEKRQGLVGLHASFTIGNETLKSAVELMKQYNTGAHIHVAEDLYDQTASEMEHKKAVVERLSEAGILDSPASILVHCLHLNQNERRLIANSEAWVAQNPESNMNNKVGFFNAAGMGENIMMGTDGMHSDMLQSAKAAFFSGQQHDTIDYPSCYKRFRNVHHYLKNNNFKGDGDNNLVVLDYDTGTEFNSSNFLGHFLFGWRSNHVLHVISNGKLIVKNRELQTVCEQEILDRAKELSIQLWDKMKA